MSELERSVAPRNGLPEFRPYRYNGTGEDIYRGQAGYLAGVRRCADADWDPAGTRDRHQAALAAVPEPRVPEPAPTPPVTPASRCGQCGYLTTASGHRVMCDD